MITMDQDSDPECNLGWGSVKKNATMNNVVALETHGA